MSDHDSQHGSSELHEAPKKGSYFLLTFGVLLLVLLVVVGASFLTQSGSATETEDAERAAVRTKNLAELQAADAVALTTYGWSDKAKGIVHIPVTHAMELVLPSLNAKPTPTPEPTPVVAPLGFPVPVANAAATNAPAIAPSGATTPPKNP